MCVPVLCKPVVLASIATVTHDNHGVVQACARTPRGIVHSTCIELKRGERERD